MAVAINIEPRTVAFVQALKDLEDNKKKPATPELLAVIGLKTKSALSNIKSFRQNIKPQGWLEFKRKYGSQLTNKDLLDEYKVQKKMNEQNLEDNELKDEGINYQSGERVALKEVIGIIDRQSKNIEKLVETMKTQSETMKSQSETLGTQALVMKLKEENFANAMSKLNPGNVNGLHTASE